MLRIKLMHFAPGQNRQTQPNRESINFGTNKELIWAILEDADAGHMACGYIPNVFGINELTNAHPVYFNIETDEVTYMEHGNGGRTNPNRYSSIESYWEDPLVEATVKTKYKKGLEFSISYYGTPEEIDQIHSFTIEGFPDKFELSGTMYEASPPEEWYNEVHAPTVELLKEAEVFETFEEAYEGRVIVEDIFGNRCFPVLKAPKELVDIMEDCACSFKGNSDTLTDGEFIYIGLRSKMSEFADGVLNIYDNGGKILKNQEWNW